MHPRRVTFIILATLGLLLAVLHGAAEYYSLYWYFWWFDIVVHFVGGATLGLAALWFLRFELPHLARTRVSLVALAVVAALVFGILWEVFEFATGTSGALHFWPDTLLDLLMDLVGAVAAYFAFIRYVR
jgi:hypothetical protein